LRLFIDTANVEHIREINDWGVLDGVTTNPSLACKENRNYRDCVAEIASIVKGPVSAEAVSMECAGMLAEARELAAISALTEEGIKTNCTLIFSANQALLASAAGATFASPFIGRLDDIGNDGMRVLAEIVEIYEYYGVLTEVISASLRHPQHVVGSALAGAHIATIPYDVFKKMASHPLTDIGIERFLADWDKIKDL
jgi:transaldolase